MKQSAILQRFFFILVLLAGKLNSHAQLYFLTKDVLENTRYVRKKQTLHTIQDASFNNGTLTINLIATLDGRRGKKHWHMVLPIDSILSYYKNKTYFYYRFDSATSKQLAVNSLENRFTNISGRQVARGIDVMCPKEILAPGFTEIAQSGREDTLEILSGKEHPFEYDHKTRTNLKGKHLVLLLLFKTPHNIDGVPVDYLVINIENSPRVNKLNYLKLPFALLADTVMFPFALMLSGMEK